MSQILRARFLAALTATGAASIVACGGSIVEDGPGRGADTDAGADAGEDSANKCVARESVRRSDCGGGAERVHCFSPRYMRSIARDRQGDASMACTDGNGCLPSHETSLDCETAVGGPVFREGQCCYLLCSVGGGCGRPYIVDGAACTAPVVERSDWHGLDARKALSGELREALSFTDRERLAGAWARDAAMEHASIAAFARFTLDLLSHGAPADMLAACQDAAADETRHAAACFAIASRLAGRSLGPGPLEVGVIEKRALAEVVASTVVEGCIGETLSALVAEARLQHAADASARAALAMIAEDEARHAELAWRFVGWAIREGGPAVREAAARALQDAEAGMPSFVDASLASVARETIREHGLLDEASAREVVARAYREVIAPCAAVILEGVARAA